MGVGWKRLIGEKENLCNTFNNKDKKKKKIQEESISP